MMQMSKDSLLLIQQANRAKGNTENAADTGLEGQLLLNIIDVLQPISTFMGL